MLAVIVLVLIVAALVVAWGRLGLANCRLGRVALIALGGGFLGAFALYSALILRPLAHTPAWLVVMSDALLLVPLLLLTRSTGQSVLSSLAPLLLGAEFSIALLCIMVVLRQALRAAPAARIRAEQPRRRADE